MFGAASVLSIPEAPIRLFSSPLTPALEGLERLKTFTAGLFDVQSPSELNVSPPSR